MPGKESHRKAMQREFAREAKLKARAIKRKLRRVKSLNPGKGKTLAKGGSRLLAHPERPILSKCLNKARGEGERRDSAKKID